MRSRRPPLFPIGFLFTPNTSKVTVIRSIKKTPLPVRFGSLIFPGPTTPIRPPTKRELKIFEPNRLPIIKSVSPRRAHEAVVTSSGKEVPIAISKKPTKPPVIPQDSAKPSAPRTVKNAPSTVPPRPPITRTIRLHCLHLFHFLNYFSVRKEALGPRQGEVRVLPFDLPIHLSELLSKRL